MGQGPDLTPLESMHPLHNPSWPWQNSTESKFCQLKKFPAFWLGRQACEQNQCRNMSHHHLFALVDVSRIWRVSARCVASGCERHWSVCSRCCSTRRLTASIPRLSPQHLVPCPDLRNRPYIENEAPPATVAVTYHRNFNCLAWRRWHSSKGWSCWPENRKWWETEPLKSRTQLRSAHLSLSSAHSSGWWWETHWRWNRCRCLEAIGQAT